MKNFDAYMVDPDGKPSSARLMAWKFMLYFFFFNSFMTLALLGMSWILRDFADVLKIALQLILGYTVVIDFLILLAIFVPKQLGKIAEVKELIETVKAKN